MGRQVNSRITVHDVVEQNDCSGKKHIFVTSMEHDEVLRSHFRLTHSYMFPRDKLLLATVAPMDEVVVVVEGYLDSPIVLGEYIDNLSDTEKRPPQCRCGMLLVSDGFEIMCLNKDCALTLASQFSRLANTPFFFPEQSITPEWYNVHFGENPLSTQPFLPIIQPKFWGQNDGTLEGMLLREAAAGKLSRGISIANFLTETLFRDFLETRYPFATAEAYEHSYEFENLFRFFGDMDELIERRDYSSPRQNHLITHFIWALGIESLSADVISKMLTYETSLGDTNGPMFPYAYLLSHPGYMVSELGLHPLEAREISRQACRKRFELFDIFSHYSSISLMRDVFSHWV